MAAIQGSEMMIVNNIIEELDVNVSKLNNLLAALPHHEDAKPIKEGASKW